MFETNRSTYEPIVRAVMRDGENATIPDKVHMWFHDHDRKILYEDMIDAGYSEYEAAVWCFGFHRYANGDVPEGVGYLKQKGESDD